MTEDFTADSSQIAAALFDLWPYPAFVAGSDERARLIWTNEAFRAWSRSGRPPVGITLMSVLDPSDVEAVRAALIRNKEIRCHPHPEAFNTGAADLNIRLRPWTDENGGRYVLGVFEPQRDAWVQQQLAQSKILFRSIFEQSPVGIVVVDSAGRILSVNPFAERLTGLSKETWFNASLEDLVGESVWRDLTRRLEEQGRASAEFVPAGRCEGDKTLMASLTSLCDESGRKNGYILILSDVTAEKQAREALERARRMAEEASQMKSLFLANMSHEVRTPLNTILGMLDLTLDGVLSQEQKENIETIQAAAKALLVLLDDILDLARVESGKIELERIPVNVSNLVQSVCRGMEPMARKKGLGLKWSVADEIPEFVLLDPTRLRQVLTNLINNAIKFSFSGDVVVTADRHPQSSDGAEDESGLVRIRFCVADQGIGVPKDKQAVIFEAFSQADNSTTRRFGGSGLGLAICRRLVELMDGRIWVESEEFEGSRFYFTVAAQRTQRPQHEERKALDRIKSERRQAAPLRILLAEDNPVNQKMAQKMLQKKGWTVVCAGNGRQVLELLNEQSFDVILMDAQMPVMDGYEATRKIRLMEQQRGGHIPIIALTARVMTDEKERCLKCGMDAYVSKPIEREKLFETIERTVWNEQN